MFWVGLGYFQAVKRNLAHYMYGDALVVFGWCLGGLGCFNGPHDGYANRSKSKTSLQPNRFTDSSASRCRLTHDIWYPARCSAVHKN